MTDPMRQAEAATLIAGAQQMGVDLTGEQANKLLDYLDLLQKWNKAYNLTAVRDRSAMLTQHLLDSLSIVPHLPPGDLLDVGSGGGLPGIPLAILQPERSITLIDTVGKKVAFLKQAAMTLGLKNLQAVSDRIESWVPPAQHAAGFRVITARAYATLQTLVGQTARLLAPNGGWFAMKGVFPDAEMAELTSDVSVRAVIPLDVPGLGAERHLVLLAPAGTGS
ncbi:MAG: 16S rRNA (guanine(527)-N(7))-methyltransferase RsmG [Fluviibacter sp.]